MPCQASTFHGAANLSIRAVGNNRFGVGGKDVQNLGYSVDGQQLGAHTLLHQAAHLTLHCREVLFVQGTVALAKAVNDGTKTHAAEFFHVLTGGEGQAEGRQNIAHHLGEKDLAIDQSTVGVEEQAER